VISGASRWLDASELGDGSPTTRASIAAAAISVRETEKSNFRNPITSILGFGLKPVAGEALGLVSD